MADQDYIASGFNAFLSRSIDNGPSVNLDSTTGPVNYLPFDRLQVSGSQGDAYTMGGITMSAKDNSIALNDGEIDVNDTKNDMGIKLSGSKINYVDNTGNTAVIEGLLPDNSVGFRLQTKQGVGLAQFSRDINGNVALKIAKNNVEVSTATSDQLIVNSNQDMFKIVTKGTTAIPAFTIGTGQSRAAIVTIPHGLSFTPLVDVYVSGVILNLSLTPVASSYIRLPIFISQGTIQYYFQGASTNYYPLTILYAADATNIYIEAYDGGNAFTADTMPSIPVSYFLLQETAT